MIEERIEKAAQAIIEELSGLMTLDAARKCARAALPHLKVWEEPTEEELEECRALLDSLLKESQCGGGRVVAIGTSWAEKVLNQFIRHRKAPPEPPKPIDVIVPNGMLEAALDAAMLSMDHSPQEELGLVQVHLEAALRWQIENGYIASKPAPPVPDPRREALEKAFNAESGGPWPGKDEWVTRHAEIAISALDSLKGSQ